MIRILTAALLLAGCSGLSTEQVTDIRLNLRALAINQIEAWNAAGVDPLQKSPQEVAQFSLACAGVAGISAMIPAPYGDVPEEELTEKQRAQLVALESAPAAISDFCAIVAKALAPAEEPEPAA